jgi:AraC family transcriptional regulator
VWSRFHLHRAFRRAFGETPKQYTQRLRLEQAAARLLGTQNSVSEIARAAGFTSHEVFTRAFRRRFGRTPERYRAGSPRVSKTWRAKHIALTSAVGPCVRLFHLPLEPKPRISTMPTLSIERRELAAQPVLLIRRQVSRAELPGMLAECFGKLFAHGSQAGLSVAGWPLARYLSTGPGLLTVEAAMPLAVPAAGEGEMEAGTLPAGPAAVGIHAGPYDQLPETFAAMEKWMQAKGHRAGGAPWEWYVTDPAQHPNPADWRTEVYWPLAE